MELISQDEKIIVYGKGLKNDKSSWTNIDSKYWYLWL